MSNRELADVPHRPGQSPTATGERMRPAKGAALAGGHWGLEMSKRWLIEMALTAACWLSVMALIVLRLLGETAWPWWWIIARLWAPIGAVGASFAVLAVLDQIRQLRS
jgi:hypothetical protein